MVTKKQIKLVKSLQQKKYRTENGLFVIEGLKSVNELLKSEIEVSKIYASSQELAAKINTEVQLAKAMELDKMSSLRHSNGVLGVFKIPERNPKKMNDWTLALDAVRDPGNLGTIIRLCDWFGISQIICSADTVDCYNPKVLQATMGSIARVGVIYTDLVTYLNGASKPIFGAFMEGDNVYDEKLPSEGILVMGNEANGISPDIEKRIQKKIAIPQFGKPSAESLNVATATSILLSEIRRGG